MSTNKKKWWQIWKKRRKEPESELEKATRTYKDIAKEYKKKQEFEIVTIYQKVEATYKIIVRVLIGIVFLVVIIGFIKEYQKDELVIENILVYEELQKQGVDGTILRNSIIEKINEIKEVSSTSKETQAFKGQNASKSVQIRLPVVGSAFSLNSVYEQLKSALGKTPKIASGSIVKNGNKVVINLIVLNKTFKQEIEKDSLFIEKLVEYAAISIIKQTEPYLLAAYYIQKGQLDNAIEISKYCISHEPKSDDKWAYLIIGRAEFMKKRELSAIEYTKRALQLDKKFANAYINLGFILQSARKPDFDKAIQNYKKAISINPKYATAYANWGSVLLAQQKYGEALEKYKIAYSLEPNNKFILHRIGFLYSNMKKYDEALIWYKKSKDVDPTFINAYWGIIEAYREKKYGVDQQDLLDVTEDAMEINPSSIIPYFEDRELIAYKQKPEFQELFEEEYNSIIKNKEIITAEEDPDVDAVLSLAVSL